MILYGGVFMHDLWGVPDNRRDEEFVESFDDFKEELAYSEECGAEAIHLTKRKPRCLIK